jgi:hypothetical protein
MMKLLKKAENTMAFFKCGFFGFQGSGKTYTAGLFAKGICDAVKNNTLAFFDTETGSDFLLPHFGNNGIEVFQTKSRAFSDLLEFIKECEQEKIGVAIIDSITHIWRDLMDSYKKKLGRKRLEFQDWDAVKGEWQLYTDSFVNSKIHLIVCGRAGYEYDYDYNEDGSKDLVKTGTKMKAESEFGFEPSLVIEMERVSQNRDEVNKIKNQRKKKQAFNPKIGSNWIHRAHVLKDRTDTLNGKSFDYPTFDDFLPHFQALNIGGDHLGVDTTRTSEDRFDIEGRPDWRKRKIKKDIALEKIQETAKKIWPGTKADEKKARQEYMEVLFNTLSWTEITEKPLGELEQVAWLLSSFEQKYKENPEAGIKTIWDEVKAIADLEAENSEPNDIPM